DDKVYQAVDDPTQTWVAPKRLDAVPFLNFSPLENAVATLKTSASAYNKAITAATAGGKEPPADVQARLDEALMKGEGALPTTAGRPPPGWDVHQIPPPPAGRAAAGTPTRSTPPASTPATASRPSPPSARRSSSASGRKPSSRWASWPARSPPSPRRSTRRRRCCGPEKELQFS